MEQRNNMHLSLRLQTIADESVLCANSGRFICKTMKRRKNNNKKTWLSIFSDDASTIKTKLMLHFAVFFYIISLSSNMNGSANIYSTSKSK